MDKQKQMIEEMAKVIIGAIPETNYEIAVANEEEARMEATALYNAGYRKIPELPKDTVLTADDIAELLTVVARDKRKETARKFAKRLKDKAQCGYSMGVKIYTIEEKAIDEIAKEIKENKV